MDQKHERSFASDTHAGIHPEVLQAIVAANSGHVMAYGADPYTERAVAAFREHFGGDTEVFFVLNGSAANVLSVAGVAAPYHCVICAETSHMHHDECGAVERFTGARAIPVPSLGGKLTIETVRPQIRSVGFEHASQPRLVSMTQATETGTVYTTAETRELADFVHDQGLLLHMDGSRLANAAAHLAVPLRALTGDVGVDVLSFGGTKNGLMIGEAVLFFDPALARDFKYVRKQGLQLAAKMRFISAQFEALLSGDLWLRSARHANRMAQLLSSKVSDIAGVNVLFPTQANGVFAEIPTPCVVPLQEEFHFYCFDLTGPTSQVRWMAAFDTTEDDVEAFAAAIEGIVGGFAGG